MDKLSEKQYTTISWDDLMSNVKKLADKLPRYSKIWGIPRGGKLICWLLAYQNHTLSIVDDYTSSPDVIIIEDIIDSGRTISGWKDAGYKTASVYFRDTCPYVPDYFVENIDNENWLIFPYEKEV